VKKVGPPFSQDSPERGAIEGYSKQSYIHLLKYHITNWRNRIRPVSLELLQYIKTWISRMVISSDFKEEIPSIQSLQSISESYPKSDLLSKSA
jgi:hypothetical protein